MKKQILILISGKIGAGKSTVAEYLHNEYKAGLYHLGTGVRSVTSEIFNINPGIIFNDKMKNQTIKIFDNEKITPRELLQKIGLGIKQIAGNDIWCKKLYSELKNNHDNLIVIDDYRFPEEYDFFVNKGYKVMGLRINRNNAENNNHLCENQKLKIDYTISNNGSIEDLHKTIDKLMFKSHIGKCLTKVYNKVSDNIEDLSFWDWMLEFRKKS